LILPNVADDLLGQDIPAIDAVFRFDNPSHCIYDLTTERGGIYGVAGNGEYSRQTGTPPASTNTLQET
jgi:hypothetical protein